MRNVFWGEYDKPLAQIAQNKDKPYNSEVADVCISLLTEGGFKFKS